MVVEMRRGTGLVARLDGHLEAAAQYTPRFRGGVVRVADSIYRLKPPSLLRQSWIVRGQEATILEVEPSRTGHAVHLTEAAAGVQHLDLLTGLALTAIVLEVSASPPASGAPGSEVPG